MGKDNRSGNKRIARNFLFLSIRMLFVMGVSLYSARVLLNALGVVDFGIQNVVAGFVSMFAFLNTTLSGAIQRFYNNRIGAEGAKSIGYVYNTAIILQIGLAVIILILLETVGMWYVYNKMVIPEDRFNVALIIYQFSIISSLIVIIQAPFSAAIMAYERMDYYAFVSIFDAVAKLGFVLALPYISLDNLLVYGLFILVITLVNFLLYFIYCKRNFKWLVFTGKLDKTLLQSMFVFTGWNFYGSIAGVVRTHGVNLLLNLFFGPVVNAARGLAYQVSSALDGCIHNINIAVRPQLMQSYGEGNSSRTLNLMNSMSKLTTVLMVVLYVPLIYNIDGILKLWLGNVYPVETIVFIDIILIESLITNLQASISDVVQAVGRMKFYQLVSGTLKVLIIPVAYIFLELGYPAYVAFIVSLAFSAISLFARLIIMSNLMDFSVRSYLRNIFFPLMILALIAFAIIYLVHIFNNGLICRLVAEYVVVLFVIVPISFFIVFDRYERDLMRSIKVGLMNRIKNNKLSD